MPRAWPCRRARTSEAAFTLRIHCEIGTRGSSDSTWVLGTLQHRRSTDCCRQNGRIRKPVILHHFTSVEVHQRPASRPTTSTPMPRSVQYSHPSQCSTKLRRVPTWIATKDLAACIVFPRAVRKDEGMYSEVPDFTPSNSIGGLVVKLAVAIRDAASQMIRPAPGSIPGRCILLPARLILLHYFSSAE